MHTYAGMLLLLYVHTHWEVSSPGWKQLISVNKEDKKGEFVNH